MAFARPVPTKRGPQRVKVAADENAGRVTAKSTTAASSTTTGPQRVPLAGKAAASSSSAAARPALGDITSNARRDANKSSKPAENTLKRGRSGSLAVATGPQRVPVGPAQRFSAPVAAQPAQRQPARASLQERKAHVVPQPVAPPPAETSSPGPHIDHDDAARADIDMELDDIPATDSDLDGEEGRVEHLLDEDDENEDERDELAGPVWPDCDPASRAEYAARVADVREHFEDNVDTEDPAMVSEYADEIFKYMEEIEIGTMPNPDYIQGQSEITWDMRQTLVDWLLQVHMRYHMLPETLWIAVNIVDRFLTKRVVSLIKLQLVGVTAMFIAAKYEEVLAPSVEEFVYMTDKGYSREEILKGERIILQTLEFRVSTYCSPYSWVRKISKADDYDIQTRTLSKFIMEVTLLDHRFLRAKPSLIAAVGMYCSRRMLGGDWNDAFVYYSGYTAEQLEQGHQYIVEKLAEPAFETQYVYKKYANKRFLKASLFARDWAIREGAQ